jgi:hypothetical protein
MTVFVTHPTPQDVKLWKKYESVFVTGSSFNIEDIPQTHKNLKIDLLLRFDAGGGWNYGGIYFDPDVSLQYHTYAMQYYQSLGSGANSGRTQLKDADMFAVVSDNFSKDTYSHVRITIPDYTSSNEKNALIEYGALFENASVWYNVSGWCNVHLEVGRVIDKIQIYMANGSNFLNFQYYTVTLEGLL